MRATIPLHRVAINCGYWYLSKGQVFCTIEDDKYHVVHPTEYPILVVGEYKTLSNTPYFVVGKHTVHKVKNVREARKLVKQLEESSTR